MSGGVPVMGLPPRDPRSKSKNMAMKMINKIGSKSFNKKASETLNYSGAAPGVADMPMLHKPLNLVSRLRKLARLAVPLIIEP